MKTNEGEVPQYYVENSHPAIIPSEEWEQVQSEILRRKSIGKAYSGKSPLCAKLICEDCGSFYGRKIWHSTDKYKRAIWRCSGKYSGEHKCQTPTLETEKIQQMFITAYNLLMASRQEIIDNCELIMSHISNYTEIDEELQTIVDEMSIIAELVKKEIQGNASSIQSQEEYQKRYNSLTEKYDKLSKKAEHLQKERIRRVQQEKQMQAFIESIRHNPCILTEWNDTVWLLMIEKGIVHRNKSITFVFRGGEEITVEA